jgi:hypothetical protein
MKTPKNSPHYTITLWIFLILLSFAGCKDSSTSPTDLVTNAPVIASVTNVFTYVMAADNFTAGVNYDLTFTTDSLIYTTVVSNFGRGSFTFTVGDASGNTILRDSVFTTKVNTVIQSGKGIPKHCTLNFQNFTGSLNLALTSNQVKH